MKMKVGLLLAAAMALSASSQAMASSDAISVEIQNHVASMQKSFDDANRDRASKRAAALAADPNAVEPADVQSKMDTLVMDAFSKTGPTCQSVKKAAFKATSTFNERRADAENFSRCVHAMTAAIRVNAASEGNATKMLAVNSFAQTLDTDADTDAQQPISEAQFMGLTWGLGFGFSFGNGARIDSADVDSSGIVRATSSKKQLPRAVLEFHEYIWDGKYKDSLLGTGPFVAVSSSDNKVLSGVAMGWMGGIKVDPKASTGYSVGVGAILDAAVDDLADGFKDGQPAPGGATTARLKSESRWSALVFVTRTF